MKYTFPKDFLWGTATAGHQIEGNNKNCDWWEYEQSARRERRVFPLEPSLEACDSYNRYEEDFDLAAQMNNSCIRLGIEWARIEPHEGEFSDEEIEHYRKVLKAAKDRGLKTFVTLHHFTSPIWFANKGGWHKFKNAKLFQRYAKKIAEELNEYIDFYLTINEPQVYSLLGYKGVYDWDNNAVARWAPAKDNYFLSLINQLTFMRGHCLAYQAIKEVRPAAQVGIVKNISWYETDKYFPKFWDQIAVKILNFTVRSFFLVPLQKYLDFIGLNYYFTNRLINFKIQNPNDYTTDMGWWINPSGLEGVLSSLKAFNKPIYITENGLADSEDKLRKRFIRDHLIAVSRAIKHGADVRGYMHWSLIDNYEWHHGFWPRFGLVEIDRENGLKRSPRGSFYYYAGICSNNEVVDEEPR